MKQNYQAEVAPRIEKKIARAVLTGANVSLKFSTEICNQIRGKPAKKVEVFLTRLSEKKDFLALPRYNKKVAHRKGDSVHATKSGRYPQKTANALLGLLQSAMANADYRGLDAEKLVVLNAFASMAFGRPSFQTRGKIGGKRRKRKSCHVEIVLLEAA